MHRQPGRSFDVYGMKGLSALLHVKTYGIDDAKGAHDGGADGCILANVCPDQLERLARTDPIGFLRATLLRYRREVHGYRVVLQKQERLNGKVGPVETLDVCFREEPFSALLKWRGPSVGMADRVLYVAGANDGQILARGKLLHGFYRPHRRS